MIVMAVEILYKQRINNYGLDTINFLMFCFLSASTYAPIQQTEIHIVLALQVAFVR